MMRTGNDRMADPLVTIITPAYNYADLLPETIDSVLAQDYPNFEYIVLDDGSTDNTREVLASYDDPRLRWETHPNMGEPRTVNKGFEMGRGEYLIVVNSDDPVLPGLIRTAVEFMEAHPDVLAGYPRWNEIDAAGKTVQEYPTYEFDFVKMVKWFHCMPGPGTIIRRRAIELAGGRDVSFRWISDYDMWLRIALHGPLGRIPHVLATQRLHLRARTQADKSVAMAQEYIRLMERFYARDDLPPEIRAVRRRALGMAYHIAGMMCVEADSRKYARRYLFKSVWYAPRGHDDAPFGFKRSWKLFALHILVPGWVRPFRLWLYSKLVGRPVKQTAE
jgi:glycosyltransferase involved in cell wall biosynthesis